MSPCKKLIFPHPGSSRSLRKNQTVAPGLRISIRRKSVAGFVETECSILFRWVVRDASVERSSSGYLHVTCKILGVIVVYATRSWRVETLLSHPLGSASPRRHLKISVILH